MSALAERFREEHGEIPIVPDIAKVDVREAAAKNWAAVVTRLDGLVYQMRRHLEKMEKRQAENRELGSIVEMEMPGDLRAFYVAWQSNKQGEAPIPRPIEGGE